MCNISRVRERTNQGHEEADELINVLAIVYNDQERAKTTASRVEV